MTIKWNREEILFDTLYEADTWADSIANEIYGRIYNGYDTPDYKIAYSLAFRLACRVYTENSIEGRYKVWVIFEIEQ